MLIPPLLQMFSSAVRPSRGARRLESRGPQPLAECHVSCPREPTMTGFTWEGQMLGEHSRERIDVNAKAIL